MAALNFPNSPSLNDTHTENGVTFKWNGAAWDRLGDIGAQGATGSTGAQGSAGAAGAQGSTGPVAGSSTQVVYKDGSNNPAGSSSFTFDGTNLTVGGNVSIGGTLTYEDVTNIDSVGLITARSGIRLGGHILPDTNGAYDLGSAEYKIRHLFLSDNSLKFVDSADIEHPLSVDGGRLKFAGGMLLGSNIQMDATSGIITSLGVKVPDDQKIFLGTGNDLQIYHDGSINRIRSDVLTVIEKNDSEDMASFMPDGAVVLFHNGSQKFETTSNGIQISGDQVLDGHLDMRDSDRIRLGGSDDLSLYHNGTNSFIDNATGSLYIRGVGDDLYLRATDDIFIQPNGNVNGITVTSGGSVDLYHNANKKLETTSTGVTITNDLVLNHASGDKAIRWATGGTNKWSLYHNNSAGALVAYDNANNAERLRILSTGTVNIGDQGLSDEYLGSTVKIRKDQNSVTRLSIRNENSGSGSASAIQVGAHGNSWMLQCGSAANDSNAFTIRVDGSANSNTGTERLRITTDGKVGINDTSPAALFTVNNGTTDDQCVQIKNDNVGLFLGTYGTGHGSYPREATINGSRTDSGSYPFLRIGGQGGIKFCVDLNTERMRIAPGGQVNIGDSDINNSVYTFQVAEDLGSPSASGASLVRFKNANSTYSQDLNLLFNNSKDIIWTGGSGNGGMTWKCGTRGHNWEIGGTNRFSVGPSDVAITGATDGVLNINTTDGRGPFIRFKENGTTKVWVGSGEGMGVGDQDDACLMSVDNIYFRNSTDSRTTLTVSKEGRLSGNKAYPDASGTNRSNIYYPPTNHYLAYSAPSGGSKWLRFGYFASRGRYRVTFNSTGGYYSPGSVTFDFSFTWSSPHVYVGNINELGPQYVSKFRVTSNSSGSAYYAEVYVNINSNQTNDHIHCTAQVLGTADREFNLYNYGYDLSTLTYTSGDFNI